MRIKYVGGRSHYYVTFNRMKYNFTKENDQTLETTDQRIVNHIFSMDNRQEFQIMVDEPEENIQKEEPKEDTVLAKKAGRPKKEKK